ncbi:DUF58 domain-containing protein [Oceanobacillus alkalisoli]|uniref:DUF58 domain-containing protein n=1 Tax=Oceanobacillus alkalisoli TaxID=2925113 RepID=UPI001F12248C|nr:DUF58 domain-containing protein [Oceanobacillus alkalisoli]MCF3943090.1 DUF58 domain-containing protein [Oceanobacillus alkalisoli]
MKIRLRFIGNLLFILILLAVLFSYAMFQGGFVSWFLFYSFLPILLYHLGLLFYPLNNWKVSRTLSKRIIQAGDSIDVTIHLERKFPLPLYYGMVEEIMPASWNRLHYDYAFLNEPDHVTIDRTMKKMKMIGFKKQLEISYRLDKLPRGEHELQGVRVLISDVFGFVKKEYIYPVQDELIVQPNTRDIRISDRAVSFEQGQQVVNLFQLENTNVATGVREYAPGDRFSWIHWKQTAKNQTVMTKEFEQERSNNLYVILDACLPKRKNPLAFEASVELTLSLVTKLEKNTTDIELLTVGRETKEFSLGESNQGKGDIRYYLTKIQPDGEIPFSGALRELLLTKKRMERLVIITTSVDDFFWQTIHELRQRIAQIVIFYVQGSKFILEKEQEIVAQMKKSGVAIHVLTEKEMVTNPLEVSIR